MSADHGLFELNPAAEVRIEYITPACPALIVDQFYRHPDAVRAHALQGRYDASLAYYPGLHSRIADAALQPLFRQLAKLLTVMGVPPVDAQAFESDFSVVSTPASDMLAGQKHPHVDGLPLAGIVYLTPHLDIGTSFFTHVPTALTLVRTADETAAYNQWLDQHGEATQPASYAIEQDGIWDRIHTIAGRYNRLAMYSGNVFHSIDMRDIDRQHTMATARLTQRIFLRDLQPAAACGV